jgi:hypothetical protein
VKVILYRSDNITLTKLYISHAKRESKKLWQKGFAVICPHLNTAHFSGICNEQNFLDGYLEILKRCDAIYVLNNWRTSVGTKAEIKLAQELGKKIIYEDGNDAPLSTK